VRDELIEGVLECADGATILISSHDLSEVESFASHIGYLDRGRLQFSEEMTSLVDRFREIEIRWRIRQSHDIVAGGRGRRPSRMRRPSEYT